MAQEQQQRQQSQVVQAGLAKALFGSHTHTHSHHHASSSSSGGAGDYDLLYQWERVGHVVHVRRCSSAEGQRKSVVSSVTAMEIEGEDPQQQQQQQQEQDAYELTLEGDSPLVDLLVLGANDNDKSSAQLRFIAAFGRGRVACWAVGREQPPQRKNTRSRRSSLGGGVGGVTLEGEADVGDAVTAIRLLKSDAVSGVICLVGTSNKGVQHVVFRWNGKGEASASVVDRMKKNDDFAQNNAKDFGFGSSETGPTRGGGGGGGGGQESAAPKGLLQNVFQTFTRYGGFSQPQQQPETLTTESGMGETASPNTCDTCSVHSMEVVAVPPSPSSKGRKSKEEAFTAKLVVLDEGANLWLWRTHTNTGDEDDTHLLPLERVSLKKICLKALDLESWLNHHRGGTPGVGVGGGAAQHAVDEQNLLVKPLDITCVPGMRQEVAVLALIQDKETEAFDKVVMMIFSVKGEGLSFVRYMVLSDEWLVGATMNLQLKLQIAKDLNSIVVKGNDGHALAFAGNVHTMHEVAAIHINKYVWDACSFTLMGQVQFLFLMHDLTCNTLSQTLLDMCNNIVEALPKQLADQYSGASGSLSAVDIQLKDKLEQHFQFLNLLHSRGWLDMLDVKTAGSIVRAGEHVAALQCIRSKENLLQEQSMQDQQNMGLVAGSGAGDGKSVALNLIQSIIQDAGERITSGRETQTQTQTLKGGSRRQPWEVFYSKPLSSVLFLDMIERKVDALINQPIFEISKERVASTKDVQVQNAILNVLSRTVTETLNAVESWIRAVDASGIPALPGAFGHQEGYSWTACPSLCNSLSALSRLCLHYHSQWKTKAPNMVPKLSIQLHSLITQYLTVCDAFLQATPQEEKLRNPQAFKKYIDGGEDILGALLEASYEESNHMIQDAVAELAEVHGCYSVLYDLCEKTNDIDRLYQYMRMVQPEVSKLGDVEKSGFAAYAFERLIAANRIRDVLELPPEFNESLSLYLSRSPDHQHLLFLHLARMQRWEECSKVDTAASKLLHKILHKAGSVGQ